MSRLIGDAPIRWPQFVEELAHPTDDTHCRTRVLSYDIRSGLTRLPSDQWLLVSTLHKSIRHGNAKVAASAAGALWKLEPEYLLRRLPVIALEDVGLANLPACGEVLAIARSPAMRRELAGFHWPQYLASRLARTLKNRSACDLLSIAQAKLGEEGLDALVASLTPAAALEIATQQSAPRLNRIAALLRLDRLPIRGGNERRFALMQVCRRLELPALFFEVIDRGRYTHGLNAMLPLVFELMGSQVPHVETNEVLDVSTPPLTYVPHAALDQYTRLGQRAYQRWATEDVELSKFFRCRILGPSAARIVGMAQFHMEGSLLDHRLTNDCLDILKEETERLELERLGVATTDQPELYDILRRQRPRLNEIRDRLWTL